MKRASIIIALLLFVVVGAFALDATVTWSWSKNDPDVEYFRYQVDGEEEGAWIVVDDSVLSASFDLDVSVEHTLYLQQSYDGENWSESSHTVSAAVEEAPAFAEVEASEEVVEQPAEVVEEAPAAEVPATEPVAEQPAEQPAEAVEEPVAEPAPAVEAKAEKTHFPAQSRIGLGAVYGNTIPFKKDVHFVGASLSYTLLFGRSSAFGLGLKAQATAYTNYESLKDLKNADIMGSADLMLIANVSASSWLDIYLGVGGEVIAPIKNLNSYLVGVVGQVGLRAKLSNVFGLGLEVSDSYILYPEASRKSNMDNINAKVYLSFQF